MSNDSNQDHYSSDAFNFLKFSNKKNIYIADSSIKDNKTQNHSDANNLESTKNKKQEYTRKIPINAKFLNQNQTPAFEKNIKDSSKAIYEEPISNYDGYLGKGIKIKNK